MWPLKYMGHREPSHVDSECRQGPSKEGGGPGQADIMPITTSTGTEGAGCQDGGVVGAVFHRELCANSTDGGSFIGGGTAGDGRLGGGAE